MYTPDQLRGYTDAGLKTTIQAKNSGIEQLRRILSNAKMTPGSVRLNAKHLANRLEEREQLIHEQTTREQAKARIRRDTLIGFTPFGNVYAQERGTIVFAPEMSMHINPRTIEPRDVVIQLGGEREIRIDKSAISALTIESNAIIVNALQYNIFNRASAISVALLEHIKKQQFDEGVFYPEFPKALVDEINAHPLLNCDIEKRGDSSSWELFVRVDIQKWAKA